MESSLPSFSVLVQHKTFRDSSAAKQYIKEEGVPTVIKADGLADGKEVIVAMMLEEAYEAVASMLVNGDFDSARCNVVIEEYLEGREGSFHALVERENALPVASAQEHKQMGDADTGPNTGGMGAYSPAPVVTPEMQSLIMESIILPTVKGMASKNLEEGKLVAPSIKILHAGATFDSDSDFIANGGHVLGVTAKGRDLEEAHERAYQAIEAINWPGGVYRRDNGWRALRCKFSKQVWAFTQSGLLGLGIDFCRLGKN